jgi:hypothetical protein
MILLLSFLPLSSLFYYNYLDLLLIFFVDYKIYFGVVSERRNISAKENPEIEVRLLKYEYLLELCATLKGSFNSFPFFLLFCFSFFFFFSFSSFLFFSDFFFSLLYFVTQNLHYKSWVQK